MGGTVRHKSLNSLTTPVSTLIARIGLQTDQSSTQWSSFGNAPCTAMRENNTKREAMLLGNLSDTLHTAHRKEWSKTTNI